MKCGRSCVGIIQLSRQITDYQKSSAININYINSIVSGKLKMSPAYIHSEEQSKIILQFHLRERMTTDIVMILFMWNVWDAQWGSFRPVLSSVTLGRILMTILNINGEKLTRNGKFFFFLNICHNCEQWMWIVNKVNRNQISIKNKNTIFNLYIFCRKVSSFLSVITRGLAKASD